MTFAKTLAFTLTFALSSFQHPLIVALNPFFLDNQPSYKNTCYAKITIAALATLLSKKTSTHTPKDNQAIENIEYSLESLKHCRNLNNH